MDDEYPSIRQALLGNGHAANVRCAIKYIAWQGLFLLLAALSLPILVAISGIQRLTRPLPSPDRQTVEHIDRILVAGFTMLAVVLLAGLAIGIGYLYVTQFWLMVQATLILAGAIVAVVALLFAGSWIGARASKEGASGTPGLQRIYGYCPVSFEMEPKWYKSMWERFI